MLEGTLPFDNGNLNSLFKVIQQAKFDFTKSTPIEAKDLINRMLQPNTLKRMTIEEIKSHPWFIENQERYLFDFSLLNHKARTVVDNSVFQKLFSLGLNISPKDEDRLKAAIVRRDNYDFCAAYQELYHIKTLEKLKRKR